MLATIRKIRQMKYLIIIFSITLLSCSSENLDKTNQSKKENIQLSEEEINFKEEYIFDFDEIDHYKFIGDNNDIYALLGENTLSKKEEFFLNVVNKYPHGDTTFIDSLKMIDFVKNDINKSKNKEINEVFKTQYVTEHMSTACSPIFRDVIVFRKNGKINGIAKICFECSKHSILGSSVNSSSFGQSNEYKKLAEILNK